MKIQLKKGVMSEIIGVFILILVISVLAGMTFLFTNSLGATAYATDKISLSGTSINESLGKATDAGITLTTGANNRDGVCGSVTKIMNTTGNYNIDLANITQTGCIVKNATTIVGTGATWQYSYPYTYNQMGTSSNAINATEAAGATVVNYLPLLFLAIIFGAILAVVLRIILPYINLGNSVNGF